MNATASQNFASTSTTSHGLLAWAGWQLRVPTDWRPLKMFGDADKGSMMVGDATCACFSIHWQASRGGVADGEAWARQRLSRLGLLPDASPPAADRFSACLWARGVQTEEDKQTTHWFGYAARANLLLGIKVNGVLPDEQRELVTHHVLPSIETSPNDRETSWAMYNLSFVTPPGFKLFRRHLYMGDVAMEFRKGRRESLLLRQVYPGDLALSRRGLAGWIEAYPFKEHRRLRRRGVETSDWQHPQHADLIGLRRRGRKQLPIPLGRVAPRWNHALAVHDQTLNRLLVAEHNARDRSDDSVCEHAIARMNLPLREGR